MLLFPLLAAVLWPVCQIVSDNSAWFAELSTVNKVRAVILALKGMYSSENITLRFIQDRKMVPNRVLARPEIQGWQTGGAIVPSDIELFLHLEPHIPIPRKVFIAGGPSWYSAHVLSHIFDHSPVDTLDLDFQDHGTHKVMRLAQALAAKFDRPIRFTAGNDVLEIQAAARHLPYNFAFLDFMPTNTQCIDQFFALLPYLDLRRFVVVFHDVYRNHLFNCVAACVCSNRTFGYVTYKKGRTGLGTGFLHSGFPPGTFSSLGNAWNQTCNSLIVPG